MTLCLNWAFPITSNCFESTETCLYLSGPEGQVQRDYTVPKQYYRWVDESEYTGGKTKYTFSLPQPQAILALPKEHWRCVQFTLSFQGTILLGEAQDIQSQKDIQMLNYTVNTNLYIGLYTPPSKPERLIATKSLQITWEILISKTLRKNTGRSLPPPIRQPHGWKCARFQSLGFSF